MTEADTNLLNSIPTPAYVVDKRLLRRNLKIMQRVQDETGCKILLALKGFSMHALFSLVGEYLAGVTASSLFEARLGAECMGKEVHIYAPAFRDDEFEQIMQHCNHIVFNSPAQYRKFRAQVQGYSKKIECALRLNPEYSELKVEIYDPCAKYSRMGTVASQIQPGDLEGLEGLHFHTMCEQNSDTLERTLQVVEEKFGEYFYQMRWINFGGGHHITRDDYDVERLIRLIKHIMQKYNVMVYLEPGEAVALNCGYLVTSVMDLIENEMQLAIIDASAACHMPDVLEMPYRPHIIGSGMAGEKANTYRLGGLTCLAGDVVGDYSFDHPLHPGDRLIFTDMAHYTMVKNNMFNGVNLPAIAIMDEGGINIIREFTFADYKGRLS